MTDETPENEERRPIEPEQPDFIGHLVWFRDNLKPHWKLIVFATMIILAAATFERFWAQALDGMFNYRPGGSNPSPIQQDLGREPIEVPPDIAQKRLPPTKPTKREDTVEEILSRE